MKGFQGVWLVASRELASRGKSRTYLISTVAIVAVILAAVVLPDLVGGGGSTHAIGVVGDGGHAIVEIAGGLAAERAGDDEEPDVFEVVVFPDEAGAAAALEAGEVEAVVVDGMVLLLSGGSMFGPSFVAGALQEAASTLRLQEMVAEDDQVAEVLAILGSDPLEVRLADGVDPEADMVRGAIAFGGLVLMYVAILLYGGWMMSAVTEEKTSRVVEVLLSTFRPWQIFAGKLTGIGILGIGQLLVVLAAGLVALRLSTAFELPAIPVDSAVTLVGWFLIGFLLYATLFGAAGSLVSRPEDAQVAAAPLTIIAVAGYVVSFIALEDPTGTVAVVGTFFPFTAPYVVPIRLALGAITGWEMALSVFVALVTLGLLIWVAGRVYAGGLLRHGSRVKWREAFRAAD